MGVTEPVRFARLLGESVRVTRRRPVVVAGALADRLSGRGAALTIWPDLDRPLAIAPTGDRAVAAWLAETFGHGVPRRRGFDVRTWSALRSRALLRPRGASIVIAAAEQALGRSLPGARVACVSATGSPLGKLLCFVFEADADTPVVVVKAILDPGHGDHLREEAAQVERVRARLAHAPEVAAALPPVPLLSTEIAGEGVVVEPVDPLAAGSGDADRETALAWLVAFARETTVDEQAWGDVHLERMRNTVTYAWGRARPQMLEQVLTRVDVMHSFVAGVSVPVCIVHGDFWSGNLAYADGQLRVYDWEWARMEGTPLMDLWTYELAALRTASHEDLDAVVEALGQAEARVAASLTQRGLDPQLARATVLPAVAEMGFRVLRRRGQVGGREPDALGPMAAAERLLGIDG